MKKKLLLALTLLIVGGVCLTACTFKEQPRQAALDFKAEYERLNGKEARSGLEWRSLNISETNPYIKTTAEDIADKIKNGETFYLYVGDDQCPWCRSGIEKMIEVAKKNNIKDIYYIDFWDDDHKEILRDLYEVEIGKKNKVSFKQTREASDAYKTIVEAVKDFAQDYTITKDGKEYNVGVKRTFGGDHFYFKDGKCEKYTSLRSDKLAGSFDDLTEEVLNDQETKFNEFFNE
jgi:predicted bacteriocin transport accessory protein